jgi:hypothetical protein
VDPFTWSGAHHGRLCARSVGILGGVIGPRDIDVRRAVFDWLTEQRQEHGEALSRASLESFSLHDKRIPLVGPQGIWKPAVCELPLSITTIVRGPLRRCFRREDRGHFPTRTEAPTRFTRTTSACGRRSGKGFWYACGASKAAKMCVPRGQVSRASSVRVSPAIPRTGPEDEIEGLPEHEPGKWSRLRDSNPGPAVYETL